MNTLDAITSRHSTRAFTDEKVTDDEMVTLLAAADAAPVGMGANEDIHLSVVHSDDLLGLIRGAGGERGDATYHAPLLIIVSAKPNPKVPSIEYANASCIIENILIQATSMDLQSIYLWGFFQYVLPNCRDILARLDLPEGFVPIAAAAVGHGAPSQTQRHKGFAKDIL